jgi:hypothetical protein
MEEQNQKQEQQEERVIEVAGPTFTPPTPSLEPVTARKHAKDPDLKYRLLLHSTGCNGRYPRESLRHRIVPRPGIKGFAGPQAPGHGMTWCLCKGYENRFVLGSGA